MRKAKGAYVIPYSRTRGQTHPLVRFGLSADGWTIPAEAYVDSGAAYSIFLPDEANRLGITWRAGRLVYVQVASGSLIPVYLRRVRIMIGHFSFPATVGFPDRLGVGFNVLGRRDIFKRLSFTFNDHYGFLLVRDAREVEEGIKARLGLA